VKKIKKNASNSFYLLINGTLFDLGIVFHNIQIYNKIMYV